MAVHGLAVEGVWCEEIDGLALSCVEPSNSGLQRTSLRSAAEAERYPDGQAPRVLVSQCPGDSLAGD